MGRPSDAPRHAFPESQALGNGDGLDVVIIDATGAARSTPRDRASFHRQ